MPHHTEQTQTTTIVTTDATTTQATTTYSCLIVSVCPQQRLNITRIRTRVSVSSFSSSNLLHQFRIQPPNTSIPSTAITKNPSSLTGR
ncbi:putative proline-rich receptor-like protein kinase PERK3 [Iris pallida]|uniref:Proline-rich receptor-like protein kinase PERK3 n=1 Tax=Iris pallida TaxID=29817 RepID=A0AAX6FTY1_IRIPA|nr:putative proline-rich receptor-like protein kinase PERK3 [Iris pallida]